MESYYLFKERLLVKCLPGYNEQEFDGLIDRIEKSSIGILVVDKTNDTEEKKVEKCSLCNNKDSNYFYYDSKCGDTICMGVNARGCGAIIHDHHMDKGAIHRNFEGEGDKNHYGPPANKLLSESVNYRTIIGGMNGKDTAAIKKLSETQAALEMNYSKIGNDERRTREGYKADQKKKAFSEMEQLGDALKIHPQVVKRAQEEFANYRDKREAVQHYEGIVAACLAYAFKEVALAGGVVMKKDITFVTRKVEAPVAISDIAITTQAREPMKAWDRNQVQSWLAAVVTETYATECAALLLRIDELLTANLKATKSQPTVSFFGTTTIAGRKRQQQILCGAERATAGQMLIRLYLDELRQQANGSQDDFTRLLVDGVRRRLTHDTRQDKAEGVVHEDEARQDERMAVINATDRSVKTNGAKRIRLIKEEVISIDDFFGPGSLPSTSDTVCSTTEQRIGLSPASPDGFNNNRANSPSVEMNPSNSEKKKPRFVIK